MTQEQENTALPSAVKRFLTLTQELTALLSRENRLLELKRPRETRELAGEKLRLSAEYQAALSVLRQEEEALLGPKDSQIRVHIKQVTETFRKELARHAKLVIRLKKVTEGIVQAVSEEAVRQRNPVRHYGQNAMLATSTSSPASLSFDQKI